MFISDGPSLSTWTQKGLPSGQGSNSSVSKDLQRHRELQREVPHQSETNSENLF